VSGTKEQEKKERQICLQKDKKRKEEN